MLRNGCIGFLVALLAFSASARADTKLECQLFGTGLEASPGNGTTEPIYMASQTEIQLLEEVTFEYLLKEMPSVKRETFQSFEANNKSAATVDCAGVKPAGRDVIVSDGELPEHSARYSISRAGVSADGNQALLFSSYYCGLLCGGGNVALFERRAGKWIAAGVAMIWVS